MKSILDYITIFKDIETYKGPPRNMAQAPIAEDLEPGALRDEMLKGFDPSQETHEEYLQRINLERPFNAAQGGRIGFAAGYGVFDSKQKLDRVVGAYRRYRRGEKNPKLSFQRFFEIYAKENFADGGSAGQLVTPSVDGSRPGYQGPPSVVGRPKGFDIKAVETVVNNANKNLKYVTLDNLAKQIDGVNSAKHLEGIIKRNNLSKLDSYGTKVEKAFIELFKDSSRNADEVIKPLHKIADMIGVSGGKERVRIENISNALKKSKILNYAEDVKPLINKLSSANFIKKIEGKEWRIFDVESSIYTKSMLRAPKTDVEHLMNYVVRHQDQAGGDAVFNIFDQKSGKRITDMSNIESYHDIIFKDSKGKTYDMDYLLRNSKTDPMFKEYYDLQDQLKVMRDKKHWPDGSKIIDPKTGKHVTFGNYSGSMYTHGYGYKKAYERFPYETDHLNLKKHPFKNLTILPQRINIALGAADRLKRPDVKYKIGGEHFRNLNVDDLMMQEKALGEKILIFDKEGTHIGKKLNTPYTAAKIKATKPVVLGSFPANIDADMFDFRKLPEDMRHFADVTKKFTAQSPKLLSALKKAKGAGKWTGAALAWEPAFALPFAEYGYKMGESPERIWGDATFGLLGETEQEELKKAVGERGYATQQIDNYGSQLGALKEKWESLNDQNDPRGEQRKTIENMYENTRGKYGKAYNIFVDDQGEFDKGLYNQALNTYTAGLVQIDKFKKQKQDERIAKAGGYENILQEREIRNIKGYMGGGMVGIRKPSALPPTGGPMSQGLRSLYINDMDY